MDCTVSFILIVVVMPGSAVSLSFGSYLIFVNLIFVLQFNYATCNRRLGVLVMWL